MKAPQWLLRETVLALQERLLAEFGGLSGLRDAGYKKDAAVLSEKVLKNMIHHLKNDHVFWEFYSADDLQAGWNKTYIWAGIAVRFLIDDLASVKH